MTFAELKAALDKLTSEQLACGVACSGDDFEGGWGYRLWVADEDWLLTEEGAERESDIPPAERVDILGKPLRVIIRKGTPQILIARRRGAKDQVIKQVAVMERG